MHFKRGLTPLWRSEHETQIGFEPRIARRLTLNDPSEHALVAALTIEHTLPQLRGVLIRAHADPARAEAIVGELADSGVLHISPRATSRTGVPPGAREMLSPAAESRALLRDDDGWPTVAKLIESTVHVVGLGRTGARIAVTLAASGIGHLRLTDSRPVTPRDCGTDYDTHDVGKPRDAVIKARIRTIPGSRVIASGPATEDDATVLVDTDVCDIVRARDLVFHSVPHLSVVLSEISGTVGPWVTPGAGPCLRCLALHRTDEDPAWPGMATQVSVKSAVAARGEDPALAGLIGSYAAAQVVCALTGHRPPCAETTIAFHLPDYTTSAIRWTPHPECGCIAPPADGDVAFDEPVTTTA
ncbi:MAG: TOMM precursor leader peptide-binding protein [Bifidobacteriaceae bacterium]|jgi:bacteriocin biosynthesis cyclodehydratase domain-containing protein|nr:TOMM precursor leader peptide-binding protein [Bifidobacteriaceae bacterium]